MNPAERVDQALTDLDAELTTDEALDADTLEAMGQAAAAHALAWLTAAKQLRRAAALVDHPALFIVDVPTGDRL